MTVYYIGDSTVARNNIHSYPQTGMSQGLSLYLKEAVRVESRAKNGRSTKSFLDEGRFAPVQAAMQPGDFLLIQFGHNDEKPDEARHTDPDTTFRENLRLFVNAAKQAGAHPVLITPIARRLFDGSGCFLPGSHGDYPEAVKKTAADAGVPVIDLTAVTEAFLAELGDEPSKPLFMWPKDNTHLKPEGAVKMAGFLAEGLKALGSPYADLLAGPEEGADR
nr:rhamnogalacturonan acetylesterase [Oscillospiraceae bacterium]